MRKTKTAKQFKKKKIKTANRGLSVGSFKFKKITVKKIYYTRKFRYKTPKHFYIRKIKTFKIKKTGKYRFKKIKVKKTFYVRKFSYKKPHFRTYKIKIPRFKTQALKFKRKPYKKLKLFKRAKKLKLFKRIRKKEVHYAKPKLLFRKRKRFQTFNRLYEVKSTIKFNDGNTKVFRTLYGDRWGGPTGIYNAAKEKILYMLDRSGGQLLDLKITKVFR